MGIIAEDFLRCQCGNAEFEQKEIVTIDKISLKSKEARPHSSRYDYICTACNKKLEL